MTVQPDHDQNKEISGKIDQIATLLRQALVKGLKEERIDVSALRAINENGGLFQEVVIGVVRKIGSIGRLIDTALLKPILVTCCLPVVKNFNASDKFREGETINGVKIWTISSNFVRYFKKKKEKNIGTTALRIHELRVGSKDLAIISELGGEEIVESSLAHMWEMMKKQGSGEEGDLLVNGYANIFYIKGTDGNLWAVSCDWLAGYGWRVGARPFSFPDAWFARRRVLSR